MTVCTCEESQRPIRLRNWVVTRRNVTNSAFNGYRTEWSRYSDVQCKGCRKWWRTAAVYVGKLKDGVLE